MTLPATIAGTLAADGRFSLMAQAIRATGLDAVLAGKGPFTVCAPTDEAFRRLPSETLAALMDDLHGQLLRALQYHILFGNLPCSTIKKLNFPKTLLGITGSGKSATIASCAAFQSAMRLVSSTSTAAASSSSSTLELT